MLYVRSGVVPDVTYDLIPEHVTRLLEIPVGSLVQSKTNLEAGSGYANFARLTDPIYCPFHDGLLELRSGGSGNLFSSVWTKSGRQQLNIDQFKHLIQLVQPNLFESMFDGDTPTENTSDKRLVKDRERGLRFLESSLAQSTSSNMIVPLVGGHDHRQRQLYLNDVLRLLGTHSQSIVGVSFEGFHSYGPRTENVDLDALQPLIEETRTRLKEYPNLLFTMPLLWRPDLVVRGVDMGFDLFSGAYVAHVSDRFLILTFRYHETAASNTTTVAQYSMTSKIYATSKQPLLASCACYTCQNYTQAYVYHLIQTKELLGRTLITIHNLHHYHGFFQAIRTSLKADRWNEYRQMILEQYSTVPEPESWLFSSGKSSSLLLLCYEKKSFAIEITADRVPGLTVRYATDDDARLAVNDLRHVFPLRQLKPSDQLYF